MAVIIQAGGEQLEGWMELVRTVRDEFPGLETEALMQGYRRTVEKFMARGEAVCAVQNGRIAGVLLYSAEHMQLCFLAVHPDYRRRGLARAMVEQMLMRMPTGNVTVQTFRQGDARGLAARPFYKALSFSEGALSDLNGYPEQDFVLMR